MYQIVLIAFFMLLVGAAETMAQTASAQCDALAAHPSDTSRPDGVAGVPIDKLDANKAIAACEAAIAALPDNPRLKAQLARALMKAKRQPERLPGLLKDGAEQGNIIAMLNYGLIYHLAMGVPADFETARVWYEKAAAVGASDAMRNLGNLYTDGRTATPNYTLGLEWYGKAAAVGNASAMNAMGLLYHEGRGVPQDYAIAREWYEKAAVARDVNAMLNLGILYANGLGGAQDFLKASGWYEKAATNGDVDAMQNLAILYVNGQGVAQNYLKAREWYEKAAAAGSVSAMAKLGDMHTSGQGTPQDYVKALGWYEKAAAAGDTVAMRQAGLIYGHGHGMAKDYSKAREWFNKAAASGDGVAMFSLGTLYANGHGVAQDFSKAREWYEKAAATGSVVAMRGIGELYAKGLGVTQDANKAKEWFDKARIASGDSPNLTQNSQKRDASTPWVKLCASTQDSASYKLKSGASTCLTLLASFDTSTGHLRAAIAIRQRAGVTSGDLIVAWPLDVQTGVSGVTVANQEQLEKFAKGERVDAPTLRIPFSYCAEHCFGTIPLSAVDLSTFREARGVLLQSLRQNGEQINTLLPAGGFAEAFDGQGQSYRSYENAAAKLPSRGADIASSLRTLIQNMHMAGGAITTDAISLTTAVPPASVAETDRTVGTWFKLCGLYTVDNVRSVCVTLYERLHDATGWLIGSLGLVSYDDSPVALRLMVPAGVSLSAGAILQILDEKQWNSLKRG